MLDLSLVVFSVVFSVFTVYILDPKIESAEDPEMVQGQLPSRPFSWQYGQTGVFMGNGVPPSKLRRSVYSYNTATLVG